MVTRNGTLLLVAAVVMAIAGRVLGVLELYLLAGTVVCLVVVAIVWNRWRGIDLAVDRRIQPSRVHAGQRCAVELTVRNRSARSTPVLRVTDEVSGTGGANLLVGPIPADHEVQTRYRLPTDHRGIVRIGPLLVRVDDPFGISAATLRATGVTELTVYPRVDLIAPVPQTTGNDPMAGAEHPNALGQSGEDFYALRHYVVGDDLRRVHWPSTARHDELMVRQDELPWQGRATVLVDTRAAANTEDSLELVISAAASVVGASGKREDLIRLATTDGYDSGFAAGHAHVGSIMEHLACVEPGHGAIFERAVDRLVRSSTGGALVVVTAGLTAEELERIRKMRSRFGSLLIVWFEADAWGDGVDPAGRVGRSAPPGTLVVGGASTFAEIWNASMRRAPVLAGWQRTHDERGAWEPPEPDRHEFDPFARTHEAGP